MDQHKITRRCSRTSPELGHTRLLEFWHVEVMPKLYFAHLELWHVPDLAKRYERICVDQRVGAR